MEQLIEKVTALETSKQEYEQRIASLTESNSQLTQLIQELNARKHEKQQQDQCETDTPLQSENPK